MAPAPMTDQRPEPRVPDGGSDRARQLGRPDGHVIVCGLKGVGLRTVEQLHLQRRPGGGASTTTPTSGWPGSCEGWGVTHIHRSAHLGDGLAEAGLDRALAVICAETNELVTLEIAMRVREARPDVRLVVQLANPSVGRALERVTGPGSVLDVAALAAPSFVEVVSRASPPTRSSSAASGSPWSQVDRERGRRATTGPSGATSATWPRWPSCRPTAARWRCARAGTIPVAAGRPGGRARARPTSSTGPASTSARAIATAAGLGAARRCRLRRRLPRSDADQRQGPGVRPGRRCWPWWWWRRWSSMSATSTRPRHAPPRPADLALLHGRDRGHGRVRRLLLRAPRAPGSRSSPSSSSSSA